VSLYLCRLRFITDVLRSYAYLAGTTQTPAGPAVAGDHSFSASTEIPEEYESAVWSYDPKTQAITSQWINTDGSAPATHIVYANDDSAFQLIYPPKAFSDSDYSNRCPRPHG
jgi:hypothetical protein